MLELSSRANGRFARRDEEDGISGEQTGGGVLYAFRAVRWFTSHSLVLEAGARFPTTSSLNGEQEERATACIALSLAGSSSEQNRIHGGTSQGPRPKGAWRVGVLRAPSCVWTIRCSFHPILHTRRTADR